MNYCDALAWLYATQRFGIKLGLENTERLLRSLRIEGLGRVVHVAGTNGKGSVCAMIDSICRAAGYRSGLFTSPHLMSFRERIRVEGKMISKNEVAKGLSAIHELIGDWAPTFFEITTALALRYFQNARCEIIVLETGMGGRLDSTNAVPADVAVITPIDLDHQKWLGDSIAQIATEKAGIIKSRVPVICAAQHEDAARVIRARAEECSAPLQFVVNPWTQSPVGLRGGYQRENAAVAVAAVRALNIEASDAAIRRGLESVEWPARFQQWGERMIIDGAHNPAGARALVKTWKEQFDGEQGTVILAVLQDKNTPEIVRLLAPIASQFILPRIRSERAVPPPDIARYVSAITPPVQCFISPSTAAALMQAQDQSGKILITGSLHFAGEALAFLRNESHLLEDCLQ